MGNIVEYSGDSSDENVDAAVSAAEASQRKETLPDGFSASAKAHFISMGYSADEVEKAIKECDSTDENAVLERIILNQEIPNQGTVVYSPRLAIHNYFLNMGYPSFLVAKAIEENDIQNEAAILESILSYQHILENLEHHFTAMGYSSAVVKQAIADCGTDNEEAILETIKSYEEIEKLRMDAEHNGPSLPMSDDVSNDDEDEKGADCDTDLQDDNYFSKSETYAGVCKDDDIKADLLTMGFSEEEILSAIETYGSKCPVSMLIDHIYAIQCSRTDIESEAKDSNASSSTQVLRPSKKGCLAQSSSGSSSSKLSLDSESRTYPDGSDTKGRNKCKLWEREINKKVVEDYFYMDRKFSDLERTEYHQKKRRKTIAGPPYFYFENVELALKGVWETMSRFLYDIEPEFVDSKQFSVSCRKRGYIHNLPTEGRCTVTPPPPMTIFEAFPETKNYWPHWDPRTKLNCISTVSASAALCDRLRDIVQKKPVKYEDQKKVIQECKKWNLLWVGPDQLGPLEPHEMELALGFDVGHTRGASCKTKRVQALGNSFQVDTVAYHLSVLKREFPQGINVLSLFSGIGGAEVALHKVGMELKCVVSVEKSRENRVILSSWWTKTQQKGKLIELEDVENLTNGKLEELMDVVGGFDLIIGGSPCNNLTGSNRTTREGLDGQHSSLFFEFPRIVNCVRNIMHL